MSSKDKHTSKGDKPEVEEAADAAQEFSDAVEGDKVEDPAKPSDLDEVADQFAEDLHDASEDQPATDDQVEDAVFVDEIGAEPSPEPKSEGFMDDVAAAVENPLPADETDAVEASIAAEMSEDTDIPRYEDDTVSDPYVEPEPEPEPEPVAADVVAPPPPAAPAEKSGGGFLPAVLGGLVAAGLGFGAASFVGTGNEGTGPDPVETALAAQGDRMGALEGQISDLAAALEASSADDGDDALAGQLTEISGQLDSKISGLGDALNTQLGGLETTLQSLDERLTVVEKRPLVESSEAAQAALGAYEREIEELRQSLAAQEASNAEIASELDAAVAAAQSQMAAVEDRAGSLQEQATATAQAAAQREAMASLDASLARGTPYAAALAVLSENADVPAILSDHAESGVASMATLRGGYPAVARDALTASIKDTVSEDPVGRFSAFLRTQTGARSLAPKDGDDPDAVLSRAEAALSAGQLETVLSELSALPDAGQAAMSDWVAQAQTRLDVISAAGELAAATSSN